MATARSKAAQAKPMRMPGRSSIIRLAKNTVSSTDANTIALTTHVVPNANANRTIAADSIKVKPTPRKKKSRCHCGDFSSLRTHTNIRPIATPMSANTRKYRVEMVGYSR